MPEIEPSDLFEEYIRRDPATGRREIVFRRRHNRLRSARQVAFRQCVGDQLRGHHYRGGGARADTLAVRQAMREAAHRCAREI